MSDKMPKGFFKVIHSKVNAITYLDAAIVSHVVDIGNTARIYLMPSGEYVVSTEGIEEILNKLIKARAELK